MSTGYGKFTNKKGKSMYIDASGSRQTLNFCGTDDTDIYFSISDKEQAEELLVALALGFDHNGWKWHDPLGEESKRNSILKGAVVAALRQDPDWKEHCEAALHNVKIYDD